MSPLCESCQAQAKRTGHAAGPALRFAPTEVRETVEEPSGPFLLPHALPPDEVMEHLDARRPAPPPEVVVLEPSGPFVLPDGAGAPAGAILDGAAPAPPPTPPAPDDADVVEPSGPFLVPSGTGAVQAPFSLEKAEGAVDPYLHPGSSAVVGGVARSLPKAHGAVDVSSPSVVVDTAVGRRGEATIELPRGDQAEASRPAHTSWTPLAIAFAAGMLAGAALTIAILRL